MFKNLNLNLIGNKIGFFILIKTLFFGGEFRECRNLPMG